MISTYIAKMWVEALPILILLVIAGLVTAKNNSQYVNLFIGTQGSIPGTSFNGGNVFPGASLPWGAVKVGIDTTEWVFCFNGHYSPD
jgi:putative alpha-1,2-mannosidase